MLPAIASLAAGNTVIIKPSEITENTSKVLAKLINTNFDTNYFHVIGGGVKETTELLNQKWDKIFFTGSTKVGKIIYEAAAKNLTPVTLELGGKSPTFVLADCAIKMTVKRLVWAKFLNGGQSCIAPDYVLVEDRIKDKFLTALAEEISLKYKNEDAIPENFTAIINDTNFNRLCELLDKNKIYFGGKTNQKNRSISPTVLYPTNFTDQVMKEEIFGPILPVISFSNLEEAIKKVKDYEKPLACYVFSKNKTKINLILKNISFGGGAINDAIMHFSNSNLPFGGVGSSGFGAYHGKNGFKTFSHYKSILHKPFWFEMNLKYAPYSKLKLKILKFLLR